MTGEPLSPIEDRIVATILAGHTTYRTLGDAIGRSEGLMRHYLYRIYKKTGAPNMAGLILWALHHGYALPVDFGLCDCGRPATRRVRLKVNRKTQEFMLCARCAELEVSA